MKSPTRTQIMLEWKRASGCLCFFTMMLMAIAYLVLNAHFDEQTGIVSQNRAFRYYFDEGDYALTWSELNDHYDTYWYERYRERERFSQGDYERSGKSAREGRIDYFYYPYWKRSIKHELYLASLRTGKKELPVPDSEAVQAARKKVEAEFREKRSFFDRDDRSFACWILLLTYLSAAFGSVCVVIAPPVLNWRIMRILPMSSCSLAGGRCSLAALSSLIAVAVCILVNFIGLFFGSLAKTGDPTIYYPSSEVYSVLSLVVLGLFILTWKMAVVSAFVQLLESWIAKLLITLFRLCLLGLLLLVSYKAYTKSPEFHREFQLEFLPALLGMLVAAKFVMVWLLAEGSGKTKC